MNPEGRPGDYDEVTRLRLQLAHAEARAEAFEKALRKEVQKIVREETAEVVSDGLFSTQEKLALANHENARLKAEVERLRKAGDELWEFAKLADTNAPKSLRKVLKAWNSAKDGKPTP